MGDNPTLYGYISEPNSIVDVFGLQGTGVPFQVGTHEDLIKINAGTGLDSHHAGQKAIMGNLVANYDEMKAPAILVPTVGHTRTKDGVGIVSSRKVNPRTGNPFTSARELLARDIRELRRVYGDEVPNKQLQKLIDLNKSMYPEMRKQKPKKVATKIIYNMTTEEFVKNVYQEIFKDTFNYYFETLPTPIVGNDKYWRNSKELYHGLSEEQKKQLRLFTKLVMQDVISSIFAKLDNISSYANQEGLFELRINGRTINGDLQETFLMNMEED